MKAEKFNDKLEEIFVQRLENPSVDDDLWNLPSQQVWIGIEPHLPSRKKRRLLWLWWLGSGVLFLAGIWFLLEGKTFWDSLQPSGNSIITPVQQQVIVPSDTTLCVEQAVAVTLNERSLPTNFSSVVSRSKVSNQQGRVVVDTASIALISKIGSPIVSNEATTKEEHLQISQPIDTSNWLISPLIGTAPLAWIDNTTKYPLSNVPINKEFFSKWTLEMGLGDFLRINPTHISGNLDLRLVNNHTAFAGVQVKRQVSKNWSVGTGLSYSALQFDADYFFHLDYSATGEMQTATGAIQEYAYQLPSLASTLETRVVLVRDAQQNLQEGSDIPIEMELHHQVAYITIPTYVEYQLETEKRWKPYTKIGLLSNILVNGLETAHTSTNSLHQNVHHHSSSVINNPLVNSIAPNRLALDGMLALGLKYYSNTSSYLFVEPTLKQELRPTYNNSAIAKSTALGLVVGMGMQW